MTILMTTKRPEATGQGGQPGRYFTGDQQTPPGWYLNATEAIDFLGISKVWFYDAIAPALTRYHLPTFPKRLFFRLEDLEAIKQLRPPRPPADQG